LFILTLKKVGKIVPISFFALAVCTGASMILKLDIPASGTIPSGLPTIAIAPVSPDVLLYIITIALALALLASTDALLTSLIADNMTKTKHDSNRELIGQGLGNMLSGIFGGTACSSSTVCTVANIQTGAKTRLSGVVHSLLLIMVLLFFCPVVQGIPLAVLAGVLIKTGIDILYHGFFKNISNVPKSDTVVTVAVLMITIFGNLLVAVGVGVLLHTLIRRFSGSAVQSETDADEEVGA
jgi:SulP family sulfate permease